MENTTTLLGKYKILEGECEALLVDFLKKCPYKSLDINLRLGIQSGVIGTCERMFISPIRGLCFCFNDYEDCDGNSIIEASELMYGEMARIIDILPNKVEFERYVTLIDYFLYPYYTEMLSEYPFFCDNEGKVQIIGINKLEGKSLHLNGLQIGGEKIVLHYSLEDKVVRDFIRHLEKSVMICSEQYKIIKSFLDLQENLSFNINGGVTMERKGVTIKVESIDTTDGEGFTIHGAVANTKNTYIHTDVFMLHPQDLNGLVDYLRKYLRDVFGEFISNNLQKAFSYSGASSIYKAIINEVIDEMMASRCFSAQNALDNVVLKRMGLV